MRLLLIPLVVLTACGSESKVEAPVAPPVPEAAPVAAAPEAAPVAPAAEALTLKGVLVGDVSCYLELARASGEVVTYNAAFELCPGTNTDATPLIGKGVVLTKDRQKVAADSCQGDPECKETVEVDFVTAVAAVP